MSITTIIEDVSPELAGHYISFNSSNRPLRVKTVDMLCGIILRGQWKTTHQGIAFDIYGNLLDGQHRLVAIIKSNCTVKLAVTRGLPSDAFVAMDLGLKRSVSDLLKVSPVESQTYTGIARILLSNNTVITTDMAQDVADNVGHLVKELLLYAPAKTKYFASAFSKSAAVLRMIDESNKEYVKDLYKKLVLADLESLPPIGLAIARQSMKGMASTKDASDTYARMWCCFDRKRRENTRIQIGDPSIIMAEMKNVYIDKFGGHKWMGNIK